MGPPSPFSPPPSSPPSSKSPPSMRRGRHHSLSKHTPAASCCPEPGHTTWSPGQRWGQVRSEWQTKPHQCPQTACFTTDLSDPLPSTDLYAMMGPRQANPSRSKTRRNTQAVPTITALFQKEHRAQREGCGKGEGSFDPLHLLVPRAPSRGQDVFLCLAICEAKALSLFLYRFNGLLCFSERLYQAEIITSMA